MSAGLEVIGAIQLLIHGNVKSKLKFAATKDLHKLEVMIITPSA